MQKKKGVIGINLLDVNVVFIIKGRMEQQLKGIKDVKRYVRDVRELMWKKATEGGVIKPR